jgi:hypothetical protein
MMYLKYIIFRNIVAFVFLFFLVSACCSANETAEKLDSNRPSYKKIADEKYNENYKAIFNNDSTYLIVHFSPKNVTKQVPAPLKFFVYDNKRNKIIFEDNLTNGNIKWINDHQVQISTIPEIISGKEDKNERMYGYIYDVIAKRKLTELDKSK